MGSLEGKLYRLDCLSTPPSEYAATASAEQCDCDLWHQRFSVNTWNQLVSLRVVRIHVSTSGQLIQQRQLLYTWMTLSYLLQQKLA